VGIAARMSVYAVAVWARVATEEQSADAVGEGIEERALVGQCGMCGGKGGKYRAQLPLQPQLAPQKSKRKAALVRGRVRRVRGKVVRVWDRMLTSTVDGGLRRYLDQVLSEVESETGPGD
jgi:hypothetical protein